MQREHLISILTSFSQDPSLGEEGSDSFAHHGRTGHALHRLTENAEKPGLLWHSDIDSSFDVTVIEGLANLCPYRVNGFPLEVSQIQV